ncbi:PREDICTED: uncharacterized protein LOC109483242 isoform X1 [Branchiostoma belcheri]|uniref:Uncharacterized protein LOC109483242 isoform X1 n=1 Tax=Branchiostoma belcheri TaxID=7741 RepID=A0A6P5A699_BRABE|nr:PREDICTED: uncharacterized protein LOC109483242 isoform X1 [Branchiostoma belcheri]XP_019641786.1 PREDICTED: uncharacterized protein LOC109483242 isoform X1 [Branchiostoma belcheri]XP_019641787.1 PREDICTED: uncharacterized protein LOC109483242 isoform X1 [Branchiostoma belcheri]
MGYNVRAAWCLGILLVLLGCVSLLTGIVGLAVCYGYCAPLTAVVGAPIWSSVLVIAAGALAIASAREPSNGCKITGFLTCSLLAMVLTLVTWVLGVIDSTLDTSRDDYIRIVDYVIPTAAPGNTPAPPPYRAWKDSQAALLIVIIVLAIIEFLLTMILSIVSCSGLCAGYHGHEAPAIVVYDGRKATALRPGMRAVQQPDGSIKVVKSGKPHEGDNDQTNPEKEPMNV